MNFSEEITRVSFQSGAIRLNPETPFLWASGYHMPIYNDNRLLLGSSNHRKLIADGFRDIIINKYNECRKIVFAFPFSFDAINSGMNLVIACGNGSGDIIGIGKQNVANVANKYIII